MTYATTCGECRGEGWRTQPPYQANYHDRPLRWRAKEPCDGCGGTGVRPAFTVEIERHIEGARLDYTMKDVRFFGL